ncbi:MAG: hypothetical protein JRN21_04350 [Nitrososphaerota archaeon]|nr:hypothetical protein [Nitrososphaerota archaeon]
MSHRLRNYRRPLVALIAVVIVVAVVSAYPTTSPPRASPYQRPLDLAVSYFVRNYSPATALVPETPTTQTYWIYSDNYLVALALARYDPQNSSTEAFAGALESAVGAFSLSFPPSLDGNQYEALNSTTASFNCSSNHVLTWSGEPPGGTVVYATTSNDGSPACASQNYADLYLLQAVYYHRLGNATAALHYYQLAARDFNGVGIVDLANANSPHVYQTYKLALYVYATYCLGEQATATSLSAAEGTLLSLQSASTGGFATAYGPNPTSLSAPGVAPLSGPNTETTALAALALELMINPAGPC